MENTKLGKGYCTIKLSGGEYPLIIYRLNNGEPVLEEKEIILISISEKSKCKDPKIGLHEENYAFMRGIHLISYDKEKSPLSRDNWEKLREIVNKKLKRFSGLTLDDFVEENY